MISVLKIGTGYYDPDIKEFLIDSASDVNNLPTSNKAGTDIPGVCAPGSVAYTANMKLMYMLGNDDTWHKVG